MARRVEKFPEFTSRERRTKYPWEQWTDGSVWKVKRGEDFGTMRTTSFVGGLHNRARRDGLKVQTATTPDKETVWFQFFKE